jgi:hypothetical protein
MKAKILAFISGIFVGFVYLRYLANGIFSGDSADLVTAAFTHGVPHPPGYPLFTFLGWLLTFIPIQTPAWIVGILSVIPHVCTVAMIFLIVYKITKNSIAAFFGVCVIFSNYLFFLYSVTPEVFALLDFFIVSQIFLLVRFVQTKKPHLLTLFFLLFGLSLSHHHMILFMTPGYLYVLWVYRRNLPRLMHSRLSLFGIFFLGLLPYAYIPFAARTHSIINWNNAVDFDGFVKLVTRAYYGTFLSSGGYGQLLSQRIVQVKALGQFMVLDLGIPGIILCIFGLFYLWRTNRHLLIFFAVSVLSIGPFFFFYASFPFYNQFAIGTYERFLLPTYVIATLLIGLGFHEMIEKVRLIGRNKFSKFGVEILSIGITILLFAYFLNISKITITKFDGLSEDRTAERVGLDVLRTLPDKSIVLLETDSILFPTQYVRYVLRFRSDVIVIQGSMLNRSEYAKNLVSVFPDLKNSMTSKSTNVSNFIWENKDKFPIYSNSKYPLKEGNIWIPFGILFRLAKTDESEDIEEMIRQNDMVWKSYQNPNAGILGTYKHLMLADVLNVYMLSRLNYAKILQELGKWDLSKVQLKEAIALGGDYYLPDAYMNLGVAQLFDNECEQAIQSFDTAQRLEFFTMPEVDYFKSLTYNDCLHNPVKAKEMFDIYKQNRERTQTSLHSL